VKRPLTYITLVFFGVIVSIGLWVGCGSGVSGTPLDSGASGSESGSSLTSPSVALSVSANTINAGDTVTLTWKSQSAVSVSISGIGDGLAPNDNRQVSPQVTTTYTATAKASDGRISPTSVVTITVRLTAPSSLVASYTYKYDVQRTGTNANETQLTPGNVNPDSFGKLFDLPVDGRTYAQPLYAPQVNIPGQGVHNLLIVATEHDSVYAFDADSGVSIWHVNFIDSANGITTVPADIANAPAGRTRLGSEVGITGTPVIDPSTSTIYVSAMTWNASTQLATHRLHALDLLTGNEKFGGPVEETATVPGTCGGGADAASHGCSNGQLPFDGLTEDQRPGLLLSNGIVYVTWGSFGDHEPFHGWIMAFDATTLQQRAVYAFNANGHHGGVWMGGGAPAVDASGDIYLFVADGTFDANNGGPNYGESAVRMKIDGNSFDIVDYFTPYNQNCFEDFDLDLGSGAPTILPDNQGTAAHPHLLVGGSKEGRLYLLDRDNLGKFNAGGNTQIPSSYLINNAPCEAGNFGASDNTTKRIYSQPAYWNGRVYVATANGNLKSFSIAGGTLALSAESGNTFADRSPVATVSASGNTNGIVWGLEYVCASEGGGACSGEGLLHAYDATTLNEIWNSDMNGAQDALGSGMTFLVPIIINGKVYAAHQSGIAVFGLLK
jgi:outer membrane protein assembly factor BamB